MPKYKQCTKDTNFNLYLQKHLKDPKFKKAYEEAGFKLEIAYKINQLRREKKLTQYDFAQKLNTTQSVIARLEQGCQNLTVNTLHKIAQIFGKKLQVNFS